MDISSALLTAFYCLRCFVSPFHPRAWLRCALCAWARCLADRWGGGREPRERPVLSLILVVRWLSEEEIKMWTFWRSFAGRSHIFFKSSLYMITLLYFLIFSALNCLVSFAVKRRHRANGLAKNGPGQKAKKKLKGARAPSLFLKRTSARV